MASEQSTQASAENVEIFLQSSSQGFFAFDKDCLIRDTFLSTTRAFFQESLAGKNALDVLFCYGIPSNRDAAGFQRDQDLNMLRDLLETVFMRITDLDVMIELLPNEIILDSKIVSVSYRYLQSPRSINDDTILVVLTDVTKEKALQEQIQTEKKRNSMIIKVAMDVDGYFQYRESTRQQLQQLQQALTQGPENIQLGSIVQIINAIQGGSEIYEINEAIQLCSQMTHRLANLIQKDGTPTKEIVEELQADAERIGEWLEELHNTYLVDLVSEEQILHGTIYSVSSSKMEMIRELLVEKVFHTAISQLDDVFEKNYRPFTKLPELAEVTAQRLKKIKTTLWDEIATKGKREISNAIDQLKKRPARLILNKYGIIAQNLATRLNKQVELEIVGEEVELNYHELDDLLSTLIHIIRNAVEHGIESMEERVFFGKALEGKIHLGVTQDDENLVLKLADDGRGLDIDRLKKAAIDKGILTEEAANSISDDDVLNLVFSMGYSSKALVNGTTGRGVGLEAVKSAVDALAGQVHIQTEPGEGTSITITIPKSGLK